MFFCILKVLFKWCRRKWNIITNQFQNMPKIQWNSWNDQKLKSLRIASPHFTSSRSGQNPNFVFGAPLNSRLHRSQQLVLLDSPMLVFHQLDQVGWWSSLLPSIFHLLGHFYGHKVSINAIIRSFLVIGGSGGSKWLDLRGYRLNLGGIHPGWSAGAIWTHRNCPRGALWGSEIAPKCHKTDISALSDKGSLL